MVFAKGTWLSVVCTLVLGASSAMAAPSKAAPSKAALKHNILATLEAKAGQEKALQQFLTGGLALANNEPKTIQWFAFKLTDKTFGIFDTFTDEAGRTAHLNGEIAKNLGLKRKELLGPDPVLEKGEIIASNINGDAKKANVKLGILGVLNAKPGKEKDLEAFLKGGAGLAKKEPKTIHWYAFKLSASKFAIFDTFADEAGRTAHMNGEIVKALGAKAPELLAGAPSITKVELLAVKP